MSTMVKKIKRTINEQQINCLKVIASQSKKQECVYLDGFLTVSSTFKYYLKVKKKK